jgi:hypothetical protein
MTSQEFQHRVESQLIERMKMKVMRVIHTSKNMTNEEFVIDTNNQKSIVANKSSISMSNQTIGYCHAGKC